MQDKKRNSFLGNVLELFDQNENLYRDNNKFQSFLNDIKSFAQKHNQETFAVKTIKCLKAIQDVCSLFSEVNPVWVSGMLDSLFRFAAKKKKTKSIRDEDSKKLLKILADLKLILIKNRDNFASVLEPLINDFVVTNSDNQMLSEMLGDLVLITQAFYKKAISQSEFFVQFENIEKNTVEKIFSAHVAQHSLESHRYDVFLQELHNIRVSFSVNYCAKPRVAGEEFEVLYSENNNLLEWVSEEKLNRIRQIYKYFGMSDHILSSYYDIEGLSEDQRYDLMKDIDADAEALEKKAEELRKKIEVFGISCEVRRRKLLHSLESLKERIEFKRLIFHPERALSRMIYQFMRNYQGKGNSEIIFSILNDILCGEFDPWTALDQINNMVMALENEVEGGEWLMVLKRLKEDYLAYLNIFRDLVEMFFEHFKSEDLAKYVIEELKREVSGYYDEHESLDRFCAQVYSLINKFISSSGQDLDGLVENKDMFLIRDVLSFLYDYRVNLSLLAIEKFDYIADNFQGKNFYFPSEDVDVVYAKSACSSYFSVMSKFENKGNSPIQYTVVSSRPTKSEYEQNAVSIKSQIVNRDQISLKAQLADMDMKGFLFSRQVDALMQKLEQGVDVKHELKVIENQIRTMEENVFDETYGYEMKGFV